MSNQRNLAMAIEQRKDKFLMLVPENIEDKDKGKYLSRLAFEADMLLHANPKLASCDVKTVLLGAMEAARHKLLFSQGECSLVPFGKQAVFVLGAAGIIKILYRTGLFKKVKYGAVFENDHFDFSEGTGGSDFITHKKALKNRGGIIAAWASAETMDGTSHIYVMDHDTLMKIKGSSPGGASNYDKWPEEMYGKAPLKRLFKRLQVDGDASKEVKGAIDAMGSDMTTRVDPDQGPVFFADVPQQQQYSQDTGEVFEAKPAKTNQPQPTSMKESSMEQEGLL